MEINQEIERDKIAWFRIGVVAVSAFVGVVLFLSGSRPAAYFFLGYATFAVLVMSIFKTWRSSTEVEKVRKRSWSRMIRNIPRGIFRMGLGIVVFIIIIAIGLIPVYLTSNEFQLEHENFWNAYVYFLITISFGAMFWVAEFFKSFQQMITEFKEIREAMRKAKVRRAREKAKQDSNDLE